MLRQFLATCPRGVEPLLIDELSQLGAQDIKRAGTGVAFSGSLEVGYRCCLWSRLANRVLMTLSEGRAADADQLYRTVQLLDWPKLMIDRASFAISFSGRSETIKNSHFGALKVKDAIVDQFRQQLGIRPSVEKDNPDVRVHVHLYRQQLTISLDLSGDSLHRRGYRQAAGAAPIKENLAAALLQRAGWLESEQKVLFDPLCGSATFLIEGAMMALDIAPGLLRERFGFEGWRDHDSTLWQNLQQEARARRDKALAEREMKAYGADMDPRVIALAKENVEKAGLGERISFKKGEVASMRPPAEGAGLLICNPPYGERLGDDGGLMFLYRQLGDALKRDFGGWQASIFTGNEDLCQAVGLKVERSHKFFNGPIESRLYNYKVYQPRPEEIADQQSLEPTELSEGAQMFANRLKKNLKSLAKWRKREEIEAYRLYDADIPEYAVAVDIYADWVHVQEYAPPKSVDPMKAFERLNDVVNAVPVALGVSSKRVVLKHRKRQTGISQYERHGQGGKFFDVNEVGCRLRVNLQDYLDTGLFLDHRPVRRSLQGLAKGKDFLNLFCYTGTATVHAAIGGAKTTASVDMSATYLGWATKNMALNGFADSRHKFIQADCLQWLRKQRGANYDVIFMDPPTFSNSKRMTDVMDVQRDHVKMIRGAMRLLRPGGVLVFSNNYRKFKLDYELLQGFEIEDVTASTLDPDFKRNPNIHCCFHIRHPG